MSMPVTAFRASIFHFTDKPDGNSGHGSFEFIEDGLLVVEHGFIKNLGPFSILVKTLEKKIPIIDYSHKIIMPGFIDTHTHYPQTDIIASHGKQLMDWLETYTYPCEKKFKDPVYAENTALFFIKELLRNGTTTALVMGTVHPESVNGIFNIADSFNMRLVSGKVMMDQNAPDALCDSAEKSYLESRALIERWHHKNRLTYAVSPRFAYTSTIQQLDVAGALMKENDGVLMHTHLAENKKEVEMIKRAFPLNRSYLDVYDRFGLTGEKSVFAHCIFLDETDFLRMKETDSVISLCPTSNLFLGSGLFDLKMIENNKIRVSFGTDVGAGTSFSLLKTMAEGYKVCQLKGYQLSALQAFYFSTLGAARALGLDHVIGNFECGKEADFIVIDPDRMPLLKRRFSQSKSLDEQLFALMILGDDRVIEACYILGEKISV
jgi:guanine deaminase